jgi:hypothetical protein
MQVFVTLDKTYCVQADADASVADVLRSLEARSGVVPPRLALWAHTLPRPVVGASLPG